MEEGPNHKNNTLIHLFRRSTAVLDLRRQHGRNYSSSPVRNSLFQFIRYIFEYHPLPAPYVIFASTLRPPDVTHMMDETRPSLFFAVFHFHYTEHKPKNKKWGRPGNEARLYPSLMLKPKMWHFMKLVWCKVLSCERVKVFFSLAQMCGGYQISLRKLCL